MNMIASIALIVSLALLISDVNGQTCPTPTTAQGTCVAPGVATNPPCTAPCATPLQCIQATCLKKADSMCSTCTPNTQACIFGTCVSIATAPNACGAGGCQSDEACVEGCVPVDASKAACAASPGPCVAPTDLCVQGCAAATPPPAPVAGPPRCEDGNGNLKPNADVCDDDPSAAAQCPITFPSANGAKRSTECDKPLLADAAKKCAKTCKICCELPAYSCDDKTQPTGAPTCAQNKASGACQSFRPLMELQCPATCGLCQSTGNPGCVDKLTSGCFQLKAYCVITTSQQYMKENCAKTCDMENPGQGFCSGAATSSSGGAGKDTASNCQLNASLCNNPIYYKIMTDNCCATCNRCGTAAVSNPNCKDQYPNCASWNIRNFCGSTFYTQDQKRQYCSKTCRFC